MSISLWSGLEELKWLVGADFPEADEDALWRCSDAWAAMAAELRQISPDATLAGQRVVLSLGGDAGATFAGLWQEYTGPEGMVERAAVLCDQLAAACDNAAMEVEYAKLQFIAALITLGITLAALAAALFAGGISALGMPAAVAVAQFTIRMVLTRLITSMVAGALFNVAFDGAIQLGQLMSGNRQEWDLAKTRRAAEDGAIFGLVGGGVFLGTGRLAPGLLRSGPGLAVPLLASGGLGGLAAPLAHGEMPTGRDFLMSVTSGVVGGLGPDLARGHGPDASVLGDLAIRDSARSISTTDLSRLDSLGSRGVELGGLAGEPAHHESPVGPAAMRGDADRPPPSSLSESPASARPIEDTVDSGPRREIADPADNGGPGPAQRDHDYPARAEDRGQLAGTRIGPESHAGGAPTSPSDGGLGPRAPHVSVPVDPSSGGSVAGAGVGPHSEPGSSLTPGPPVTGHAGLTGDRSPLAGRTDIGMPGHVTTAGSTLPPVASSTVPDVARSIGDGPPIAGGRSVPGPAVGATHEAGAAPLVMLATGDAPANATGTLGSGPVASALRGFDSVSNAGLAEHPPIWADRGAVGPDLPWRGSDGQRLSGPANSAAEALIKRAKDLEPIITGVVHDLARDVGATTPGEATKLKDAERLKAKLAGFIADDTTDDTGSGASDRKLDRALAQMRDTLRYTIALPDDRYVSASRDAVKRLIELGFRPVEDHTRWSGLPEYQGFNTSWSHPDHKHVFEIQFHTDASAVAASVSHDLFKKLRIVPEEFLTSPEYLRDKAEHDAYFDDVRVPAGARDLAFPDGVDRHDPISEVPSLKEIRAAEVARSQPDHDGRYLATDDQAKELARQHLSSTDAGFAFYAADDFVRDYARAVHPTDGYLTIDVHGSARGFQIGEGVLTPAQFAEALRTLREEGLLELPDGVGIKLLSCDTARGGLNSPAAVLAARLGVEVVAPNQPVWTALDGSEAVSSPVLVNGNYVPTDPPDGTWYQFIPVDLVTASASSARPATEADPVGPAAGYTSADPVRAGPTPDRLGPEHHRPGHDPNRPDAAGTGS